MGGLGFGRSQADVLLSNSMVKERKKREDDSGDATGVHYGVASSFSSQSKSTCNPKNKHYEN